MSAVTKLVLLRTAPSNVVASVSDRSKFGDNVSRERRSYEMRGQEMNEMRGSSLGGKVEQVE